MSRRTAVRPREFALVTVTAVGTGGLILATAATLSVIGVLAVLSVLFAMRHALARAATHMPGAAGRAAVSLRVRITALVLLSVLVSAVTTAGLAASNVEGSVLNDIGPGRLAGEIATVVALNLAVAVVVGFIGASVLAGPLRSAAGVARRLGAGDLDARIERTGSGEVAELFNSYNEMAERLSEALRQTRSANDRQRRFIADAAHELRTPLAALVAASDSLTDGREGRRVRASELVQAQSQRLADLVGDLLEMSRLDSNEVTLELEDCDLGRLARDAADTDAFGETVRLTCLGDTHADVDAARVHSVLRNLLDNARQHGAQPVTVIVDGLAEDNVTITVTDEGPGVPAELRQSLFDRFVRGRASRTTENVNTGLGLAIAQENAHLHGSAITYDRDHRQTRFGFTLPRHPPAPPAV